MTEELERYDFYKVLEVEPGATAEEIAKAHEQLVPALNPDSKPEEQKRAAALARIVADAAREVLSDERQRQTHESKLEDARKAAANKSKIETKRAGKLQEEQSIEEDMKLQKAAIRYETARSALADFYYDCLFQRAKKSGFETVTQEKLMEWLNAERAETMRKAEQKGRKTSFRIDWRGFESVQDTRKKRIEEITGIVDSFVTRLFS